MAVLGRGRNASLPTSHKHLTSAFFEGLSDAEREAVLRAGTSRRFVSKTVVEEQGLPNGYLFLLIAGRARHFVITETGHKILLNWLVPGDIFGVYAALATHLPSVVGTETVKDSGALAWDRATIRGLFMRYPKLLDNALLITASHCAWVLAAHEALICQTAQQRLAKVLVGLAKTIGQRVSGGFELELTNEELAHSANVNMFTISRLMSDWQRQGAVVKRRGKVVLRSPDRLMRDRNLHIAVHRY